MMKKFRLTFFEPEFFLCFFYEKYTPYYVFISLNLNHKAAESDVYLCESVGGKKYHYTKNCRGLSNCKHEIIKVSLKKLRLRVRRFVAGSNYFARAYLE